jgi:hypothetical protein
VTLAYFDASAFVKLLVDEDGSDLAASLWDGCDAALSSRLAYPEVHAALAAAGRDRRLSARGLSSAQASWAEFWAATRAVELTKAVAERAGVLAAEHGLRGADAVHLASALAIGDPQLIVAVWGARLAEAAQTLQLRVSPA